MQFRTLQPAAAQQCLSTKSCLLSCQVRQTESSSIPFKVLAKLDQSTY